jgi:hypothetical protein
MAEGFVGTWKMESSENFDHYMREVGVNAVVAKMGSVAKPTMIIEIAGGVWTLKSETTFKNTKVSFELGKEFEETTADDRKMLTTFTLEGHTLIQTQKPTVADGVPSVITRELDGNKILVTCKANDVVAIRHYNRA